MRYPTFAAVLAFASIAVTNGDAWSNQVPLEIADGDLDPALAAFYNDNLKEERLIHVIGEDQPRKVTEADKLRLLQDNYAFLDITEQPNFTSRPVLPKTFNSPQVQYLTKDSNSFVKPVEDDLDGVIENLKADLTKLTSFWTRNYKTHWGLQSSNWLFDHVSALLDAHPSTEVVYSIRKVPHAFPQNSLIVRLESATSTVPIADRQILVLGAHQDSLNYKFPLFRAPGADDDGSGTVVNIQILRSLVELSFIPPPGVALEFHWYAAEEGGLLGSIDIASSYLAQSKPVKAMLQMDGVSMVLPGEEPIIAIYDTDSNANLTRFGAGLVEKYNTVPWKWTNCGNSCGSDHIPWNRTGYPSMYVFERIFERRGDDETYHTIHDTMYQPGFNLTHAVEFVKFGLAWITELAVSEF
ncbi:Zn-dependent exopeptidase [Flagelloscypha sp. PMI_526]|nr:Zn-dependent exopeptidase [Flagelloscypha sp. PMI_526]